MKGVFGRKSSGARKRKRRFHRRCLPILKDDDSNLPENHPVIFELLNPRGQRTRTLIRKTSLNGFYSFHTKTDPDAPTGNWTARITVGGITFEKILKIETVMPNRLKIGLDFGADTKNLSGGKVKIRVQRARLWATPEG